MLLHTVKNKLEGEGETRSLIKPAGRPFPTRHRQAKATKCGEMGGRESERPIVTLRRGNSTEGPRGVKGMPFQLTVGGKHGGCIGTCGRVHETTTDSGSRRLKRGAVCVNCASTDLWGAWVGAHPGRPGATKSGESDLENTARPIGRNQTGRLDRLRNTKRLRALQSCPA